MNGDANYAARKTARRRAPAARRWILTRAQLEDLLGHLDAVLPYAPCDHSLRHTFVWAAANEIDAETLALALEDYGGYCDDEVLYNVTPERVFGGGWM